MTLVEFKLPDPVVSLKLN